jgi:hypothetical protein
MRPNQIWAAIELVDEAVRLEERMYGMWWKITYGRLEGGKFVPSYKGELPEVTLYELYTLYSPKAVA